MNTIAARSRPSHRVTQGYLICVVATIFLSSTAILIRYLTENYHMPALLLAFWRELIVFSSLFLFFALFKPTLLRVGRGHFVFLFIYGLILSLFNSIWTLSVALNGAAISTVLVYSSVAYTAILGRLIFSESLGLVKILVIFLSLVGCVLVSGAYLPETWQVNLMGIVTGVVSGLGYAGYSLMGRATANRQINSWSAMLYIFGVATVFILAYNGLPVMKSMGLASLNLAWLSDSLPGWAMLFLLASGPTLAGYGLYTASLGYLPASVANLIATLEPVMTAGLAYLLLGERMNTPQWVGSILIILSVIVLRIYEGQTR